MNSELRESSPNGATTPHMRACAGSREGSRNSGLVAPGSESDKARATVVAPAPSNPCEAHLGRGTAKGRTELRPSAPIWNLTIPQVAGFLQVTEKTIDRMVRDQEIGSTKIGRKRMFPREEVCRLYAERFLAGRRLQPGEAMEIAERALDQYLKTLTEGNEGNEDRTDEIADLRRRVEVLEAHFLPKEAA